MKSLVTLALLICVIAYLPSQNQENCPFPYQNLKAGDECGFVSVPKSRTNPAYGDTTIAYLLIKSTSENPKKDPVVFLQGGPGGSVLELADVYAQLRLDPDRDYILYDQRGIGFSEALCPELKTSLLEIMAMDLSVTQELEVLQNTLNPCKASLASDDREFSTVTNADDLEALREHLGYETLNLFGGSYGTRLGLTYMQRYPDRVRSAILSGLFPPEIRMYENLFSNFDTVLNMLFDTCKNDASCKLKFPDLKNQFFEAYNALKTNPIIIPVEVGEVVFNSQDMLLVVHQLLYNQNTIELIPGFVTALNARDQQGIYPILAQILPRLNIINIANYYSIMTADEGDFDNEYLLLEDGKDIQYLQNGMSLFSADPKVISEWTSNFPRDNSMDAIYSDIPTFLISGEYDPVTPPSNGELTKSRLSNSQHVIFKDAGHVPVDACFFNMAQNFLNNPMEAINSDCLITNDRLDWD